MKVFFEIVANLGPEHARESRDFRPIPWTLVDATNCCLDLDIAFSDELAAQRIPYVVARTRHTDD